MFVSNNKFTVGSIQTLANDQSCLKGTLKKGSSVRITAIENRGYSIVDLESGEEMIEVSSVWDGLPIFVGE